VPNIRFMLSFKTNYCLILFVFISCAVFAQPKPGESFFWEAEQKERSGDYQGAVDSYSKAIMADSSNMNYFLKRGFANTLNQKYEDAITDFSFIIEENPGHLFALTSRGSAFNKLGKYEEAMADFNLVLEMDPGNQEAYNNRGWSKKFLGDFEGACKDWRKSKRLGNEEAVIILGNNFCP